MDKDPVNNSSSKNIEAPQTPSSKIGVMRRFPLILDALKTNQDIDIANLIIEWIEFKFSKYLQDNLPDNTKMKHNSEKNIHSVNLADRDETKLPNNQNNEITLTNADAKDKEPDNGEDNAESNEVSSQDNEISFDLDEEIEKDKITKFLKHCKASLKEFMDITRDETISKSAVEENKGDVFSPAKDVEHDTSPKYLEKGRESFLMIKQKNRWPPTTDDLLEYITIYSQMNNIKFATLNHDKYIQKNKKRSKKSHRRGSKNWKSISKADFNMENMTPRGTAMDKDSQAKTVMINQDEMDAFMGEENEQTDKILGLIDKLLDSVIIIEETDSTVNPPVTNYTFRMDYK